MKIWLRAPIIGKVYSVSGIVKILIDEPTGFSQPKFFATCAPKFLKGTLFDRLHLITLFIFFYLMGLPPTKNKKRRPHAT